MKTRPTGDLNTATFVGVLDGTPVPFETAVRKTPGCSFSLQVQEDAEGPVSTIPMVVRGEMAVNIFPKLKAGQRFLIQARARFKKHVAGQRAESPHFTVTSIVTLP